jgi:hypothetical protein
MRIYFVAAAFFMGILASAPAYSADLECVRAFEGKSNFPRSMVNVSSIGTDISYVSNVDRRSLTNLAANQVAVGPRAQLNGLTVANMKSSVGAQLSVLRRPNGTTCVWPSSVTVEVGYPTMFVYVVREYPRGTCEHAVTMEHEVEHVRINSSSLAQHMPRIRRSMERRITLNYPAMVPIGVSPSDHVVRDLSGHLEQYVQAMSAERDGRHSHLDSPESYSYWQSLCKNW